MQKIRLQRVIAGMFLSAVIMLCGGFGAIAYAESAASTNYRVNETQFGIGGAQENCSDQYCASQSAGDTTVGSATSDSYAARFGFNTTTAPYLEVWAEGGDDDLGTLSVDETATTSSLIRVRNYMSSGYIIQVTGEPPSQGSHSLEAIPTPSTSQPGSEQFGINLVANTAPDIGEDPVQVPDSSFSFGEPAEDYGTANLFKYENGGVVAESPTSSGQTEFTLSMIVNVSNVTPGGKYAGSFSAVVVPVF